MKTRLKKPRIKNICLLSFSENCQNDPKLKSFYILDRFFKKTCVFSALLDVKYPFCPPLKIHLHPKSSIMCSLFPFHSKLFLSSPFSFSHSFRDCLSISTIRPIIFPIPRFAFVSGYAIVSRALYIVQYSYVPSCYVKRIYVLVYTF